MAVTVPSLTFSGNTKESLSPSTTKSTDSPPGISTLFTRSMSLMVKVTVSPGFTPVMSATFSTEGSTTMSSSSE